MSNYIYFGDPGPLPKVTTQFSYAPAIMCRKDTAVIFYVEKSDVIAVYINDNLLFQGKGDMTPSLARRLFSCLGYRAGTAWADNVWFERMKKELPAAMPQGFLIAWEKG